MTAAALAGDDAMAREPKGLRRSVRLQKAVPGLLARPANADEGHEAEIARIDALFRYFDEQIENPQGLARVALKLAGLVFPAFGEPLPVTRARGRPRGSPKYDVAFLRKMAERYGGTPLKGDRATSSTFNTFLDDNPEIDDRLKVGGGRISETTFFKLLKYGNHAIQHRLIWISGRYVILAPVVAGIYEAARNIGSFEKLILCSRLLKLDPHKAKDREEINLIAARVREVIQTQATNPLLKTAIEYDPAGGMVRFDPLWLMKRNGTF